MKSRIFLLIFLLTACDSNDKPEDLIAEDKMGMVLAEIHLLESQVNDLHLGNGDSSLVVYQKLKVDLLKRYGLDSAKFNKSHKYYIMNPELLKNVYVKVKSNLEIKKKKVLDLETKKRKALTSKQKGNADTSKLKAIPRYKEDSIRKKLMKIHRPTIVQS